MRHALISLLIMASLALAACGSSSSDRAAGPLSAFNKFEENLVGSYTLASFDTWCVENGRCLPEDLEEWTGTLILSPSRQARLTMRFCQVAGEIDFACERAYTWSADAGVIELVALNPGYPNHLLVWDQSDFGSIAVDVNVPENRRDTDFVMVVDGSEHFDWLRTSGP